MKIIFTLCSNNYLAQALVLYRSALQYQPAWKFVIGLVDKKNKDIDYEDFGCEVIEAEIPEPDIIPLAEKYSIVELNTCVKPQFFTYLFEIYQAEQVIYLDPDTCIYSPLHEIDTLLTTNEFIITPHVLTPVPLDGCTPDEPLFLNYGIYNLGFLALRKTEQTLLFLEWWKERTYQKGYDKPAAGLFTDQLWINLVPVYFSNVAVLRHAGYNMAPWNLHERKLEDNKMVIHRGNNAPLAFFHFSSFDPANMALHKDYSRFRLHQRSDLLPLYNSYKAKLESEHYYHYKKFACYYVGIRQQYLRLQAHLQREQEAQRYAQLPIYQKMARQLKRRLPGGIKRFAVKLIGS